MWLHWKGRCEEAQHVERRLHVSKSELNNAEAAAAVGAEPLLPSESGAEPHVVSAAAKTRPSVGVALRIECRREAVLRSA